MKLWNFINSPFIISLLIITSLYIFVSPFQTPKLAKEIRGAYEELNSVLKDASTEAEKTKIIKKFVEEIARQIKDGFQQIFKSNDPSAPKAFDKVNIYLNTKKNIVISDLNITESDDRSETFIYKIKNNSDQYLDSIHMDYEFYKNDKLIDLQEDWLNKIKYLEPEQEIAMKTTRWYSDKSEKNKDLLKSDQIIIVLSSFSIIDKNE